MLLRADPALRDRNQKPEEVVRPPGGRRARSFDPARRVLHAARAERRRQDDDAAHGGRPVAARCRVDRDPRHRRARRSRRGEAGHGLDFRRADDLRQAHAVRIPRVRRRAVGHRCRPRRDAGARADRMARPRPPCAPALRGLFQGHAPEGGARRRARPRARRSSSSTSPSPGSMPAPRGRSRPCCASMSPTAAPSS